MYVDPMNNEGFGDLEREPWTERLGELEVWKDTISEGITINIISKPKKNSESQTKERFYVGGSYER